MTRELQRRDALKGIGAAAVASLAGCSGGDGSGGDGADGGADDTEPGSDGETDDTATSSDGETDDSTGGSTDSFEYTFDSDDDATGSSLTGIRANYPDGTGAVSDASVEAVTLAGGDVSDDLDGTSTSNNGASLTADFGGSYDIAAEDTLTMDLTDVDEPEGSYTVEVVINPQSGATTFEETF